MSPDFDDWFKKVLSNQPRHNVFSERTSRGWTINFDPLTEKDILGLLSREDFGERVIGAIGRTHIRAEATEIVKRGVVTSQEFGFAGGRAIGSETREIHLTPLFPGKEYSVDLSRSSREYFESPPFVPGHLSRSFMFHTHPSQTGADRLIRASVGFKEGDPFFSHQDLTIFKKLAHEEDHSIIDAIGMENLAEGAKLLLISFRTFDAFLNLDPKALWRKTSLFTGKSTKDKLNIYHETGLNAVMLNVSLEVQPFKTEDIQRTAYLLTQREY